MARVRDLWMSKDSRGKKTIRTARYGKGNRWLAVWEESGREVSKTFSTQDAAESAIANATVAKENGTYIAKAKRDITVGEVWPIWWATKAGKSKSTRDGYAAAWKHIEPKWGSVPCSQITRAGAAAWLPTLTSRYKDADGTPKPLGESSLRVVMIVLHGVLGAAVEERIIPANPIRLADAPRQRETSRRYLTVVEVDLLRAAMPHAQARLVVDTLVRTGVRPGEAFGFQVGDLDGMRGRLRVARDVDAQGGADDTKTGRHRDVPAGGDLLLDLENAAEGRARDEWLLTMPDGRGWTLPRWRQLWAAATVEAGLEGLDTYELRHTAASLAIHSGANVKTVQRMLGHRSAAMTLDIYGHLWDEELDTLPTQMDAHMKAERARFEARRRRAETELRRNIG
ncbi:tyrosine-type recombinase/integrase [Prescottella equi]|uniref:tyrosine-type recombinase/integrase n=1 Tax=Rhodococcus hoagii TaxID=43767 RepID=UPI0007CD9231|nr:site-specific integrase [Prescottella equi]